MDFSTQTHSLSNNKSYQFLGNNEIDLLPLFSINEDFGSDEDEKLPLPAELPIIALKNTVLFPNIIIPITIGREKSLEAIQEAYEGDKIIGVFTQKDINEGDPAQEDLYSVGVAAKVIKLIKMPDNTQTAILQGCQRIRLEHLRQEEPFLAGEITELNDLPVENELKFSALIASIQDLGKQIIQLSPNIPADAINMLKEIKNKHFFMHFIASNLSVIIAEKQRILEIDSIEAKAEAILKHLVHQVQVLEIRDQIDHKVKGDLDKQQRDYILNQQLKTIQEELGESPQKQELKELVEKSKDKKWPEVVAKKFDRDFLKLSRMNPQVAEYAVLLNYLEVLVDLPWGEFTVDNFDLRKAENILNSDHFGLDKVKNRMLEHLAVLKLRKDMKSPILCLVGPPGVGKTSLGRSIATALDRKYIRMSLGGLHDESELRGHRKTYIGAMPGRIVQSLKKVGSSNPVFILDEIDKLGKGFKGDPASALLEILDPEQNTTFHDNFIDVDYDLSKVLFIATANSLNGIQPALLDRMEIIEVSGYSSEEKLEIAKKHLYQKQLKEHGLVEEHLELSDEALMKIIQDYTKESGVRSLDRELAKVMRNIARKVAMEEEYNRAPAAEDIKEILGPKRVSSDVYEEAHPGVAVGLAWTSVGGDILFIEVSLSKGKGKMILTGNLGDVMKESATTALSFLKANCESYGLDPEIFEKTNIHIHIPAGAIPKDGPSAGITMLSALCSAFLKKPLRPYLAMTGEITLRGKVLPVGGIKEKVLAAKRAGIKDIILCPENQKDIEEIQADYITGVNFFYAKTMKDVLDFALNY